MLRNLRTPCIMCAVDVSLIRTHAEIVLGTELTRIGRTQIATVPSFQTVVPT